VAIAQRIRSTVLERLELTCSVGVAPNKFLAKLASVAAKPKVRNGQVTAGAGVVEVLPGEELAFLHPLPVESLWGVGPATLEKLHRVGITKVVDLASFEPGALESLLGRANGRHLYSLSHGIDDRPVEPDRGIKSIGHEETFATDRHTPEEVRVELVRMADAVAARLRARATGARTLTLKVRFSGFTTITRSVTLPDAVHTAHAIIKAVEPLAQGVDPTPGVRLLGISASNFAAVSEQLTLDTLFDEQEDVADEAQWEAAETTVDAIRERFGKSAIGPASAVGDRGLRVVRKGAQQWGPEQQQ
jgi:DNA polymerase-4